MAVKKTEEIQVPLGPEVTQKVARYLVVNDTSVLGEFLSNGTHYALQPSEWTVVESTPTMCHDVKVKEL